MIFTLLFLNHFQNGIGIIWIVKHWSLEDFKANAHSLDGIVIRSKFSLNESHLKLANKLKFIARPGSGLEHIDLDYCPRRNNIGFRVDEIVML